jgi:16S rRNA (adenine1518-N6/adenine1519-N6)-dimethyltransferase
VGDFCDWDFQLDGKPVHRFSLVGNLPYESGSRILAVVAQHADQVEHFLFMLQREVVERICASPKTSDFGSLSVLLQGQFEMKALDIVPPESFSPPPRVFSQLVMGTIRNTNRHPLSDGFQKFVQRSFAQKRKTIKNVWKGLLTPEKIAEIFKKFDLKDTQRAEEIDLDLWPQLFKEADL